MILAVLMSFALDENGKEDSARHEYVVDDVGYLPPYIDLKVWAPERHPKAIAIYEIAGNEKRLIC